MKSAVTEVMDIIEMEHNNGVEISQKVLWKMLLEAKEKEKRHIIKAFDNGVIEGAWGSKFKNAEQYYKETYELK